MRRPPKIRRNKRDFKWSNHSHLHKKKEEIRGQRLLSDF